MATVVISVITTSALLIAYLVSRVWHSRGLAWLDGCQPPNRYPHKEPIFGLDLFIKARTLLRENRLLPEIAQRYADHGRTFETKSFGSCAINTIEPVNLHAVWVSNFNHWGVQPLRLPVQDIFCGRGFITTDGAKWEHSRQLLKPCFNKANLSNLSFLEESLQKVFKRLPRDQSTVDLQVLLSDLFLDTSTMFLFGESINSLSGDKSEEAREFLEAFDYAMFGCGVQIALGPLKFLFLAARTKWIKACKTTHRFADKYVDKALEVRRHIVAGKKEPLMGPVDRVPRNLLSTMAEQTDDKIELRNQVLQALMAASETTAFLISNVFFELSRNPPVLQRLRDEMNSLDLSKAMDLESEQLSGMKYLQHVLNETMRLHPIFSQMFRVALADTKLPLGGGPDGTSPVYIRAGTVLATSFYTLHRLPSIWGSDAAEFKPERWYTAKPKPWEYVPFGGGPRACVGQQKALMEASYVVVRVLQKYSNIESRDEREWAGHVQMTSKSANGCKVSLTSK